MATTAERLVEAFDPESRKRSDSFEFLPPNFSVVLLGNNWKQNVSVENFILGKTEFINRTKCVAGSGTFEDTHLTVVNTPDLLLSTLTQEKLNRKIQDMKDLSAPAPHVFLLVLKPEDFTEQHKNTLLSVLENFSEQAFNRSLVLISTPRAETPGFMEKHMNDPQMRDMIIKCRHRYIWMYNTKDNQNLEEFKRNKLFTRISELLKENKKEDMSPGPSEIEGTGHTSTEQKPSLNLVLCGSRGAEKSSVVQSMLGQAAAPSPGQCVQHQGEVCGRWVSLVELPALSGKPLKAVMQQCLSCISLCGPEGVHAFILVLPVGPLTDEDKAELKTIQDTFSSAVNPFTMILFTVDSDPTTAVVHSDKGDRDVQELSQSCGGGHLIFNTRYRQSVFKLLESVETLRVKNKPHSYTTETLQQVHIEKILALQKELQGKDDQRAKSLRITLIGKTGTGKSSSGNTILGRKAFFTKMSQNSVTTECQKAEAEVDGRRVAVVDTPGLFDTNTSVEEGNEEKLKSISLLAPGPHVFLLVIQIGRLTPEEKQTLELIKRGFGKNVEKFTIVLLTHGDKLEHDNISAEDYIMNECDESFKELISSCGNRYHVFNNREEEDHTQVKALMKKIDDLVRENGGICYNNDLLLEAEVDMRKEIPKILRAKEREREEMVRKHQEEMEEMTQKMDELIKEKKREAKQRSVIERRLQQSRAQEEEEKQKWEKERKESEKILVERYEQQMKSMEMLFEEEERKHDKELMMIKEMLQEKNMIEQKEEEMKREKQKIQKRVTEQMEQILTDRQQRRRKLSEKEEKIMEQN